MTEDTAQDELATAKKRLSALKATKAASDAYREWNFWNQAHELLAPTGLRMRATIAALKELNPRIADVAGDLFPEHDVVMHATEDAVGVTFNNITYKNLVWGNDPNSYALRIQILFQVLEAQRLGNGAFIVIDRFDTLEKRHKNGVFTLLDRLGITALIGQTANEKPEKDALKAAGVGRQYWINDGTVEAV